MNKEKTIEHITSINKTITNRIIVLFTLCISTWGLIQYHSSKYADFVDYYDKVYLIEQAVKSENLKEHIDSLGKKIELDLYHDINGAFLLYQLKQSNYENKTPLYEVLGNLKEERKNLLKSSTSFDLYGLNVTIPIWLFIIPILSLIMFHSLCQLIITRRLLIKKIFKKRDVEYLAFDLPVFSEVLISKHKKFVNIFFRLFLFIFLFFVIITLLSVSLAHIPLNRKTEKNEFLIAIHLICFFIALFDFMIVVYSENLIGIKSLTKWYIKKRKSKDYKLFFIIKRLSIPLFILCLHFLHTSIDETTSFIHVAYLSNVFILCGLLPLGTHLLFSKKKNIGKLFIFQGIVMNILLLFQILIVIAVLIDSGRDMFTFEEMMQFSWIVLIACIPVYWIMSLFYEDKK